MKRVLIIAVVVVLASPLWGARIKIILWMILILGGLAGQRGVAQIITTVAGNGTAGFSGDGGQATIAQLYNPTGIAIDMLGNLYIADKMNHRIRKVSTSGVISTVAGNGLPGFSGDGGVATSAQLYYPRKVAFDSTGNMYIADANNNRIRKINTSGIISTVAGNGTAGNSGNGGLATSAQLDLPISLNFDVNGNMYIVESNNSWIRKVNTSGIISTVAGTGTIGFSGDGGQATLAKLNDPWGVTFDVGGNMYIADQLNYRVRKVNTSGIINTIVGTGVGGFSGDGGLAISAQLDNPVAMVFDASGNFYIVDEANSEIRKVNNSNIISTIAGTYTASGYSGDGGPANLAQLYGPNDIAFDPIGNLYIVDYYNNVIRKVTMPNAIEQFPINTQTSIYPNPANNTVSISSSKNIDEVKITDLLGNECPLCPADISPTGEKTATADIGSLQNGIYFVKISSGKESITRKLVVSH